MCGCISSSSRSGSTNILPAPTTFEIDSRPPATQMSIRSITTCLAAVAMLIRPLEHCRSMVMPGTVTGRPARSAASRATLPPVEPCWTAQPISTSSTSAPSIPARSTAALIDHAPSVAAVVLLNAPRAALVSGVRAVETMTASRDMMKFLNCVGLIRSRGGRRSDEELAHPLGDQRGLVLALDLDRGFHGFLPLSGALLDEFEQLEMAAHPLA